VGPDVPPGHADEKAMLLAWLNMHRDIMVYKIEGLTEDQARFRPSPTANSLLNLIVHLTGVERNWFQRTIAGREVARDRDAEFGDLTATVSEAVEAYRAECLRSDQVLDEVGSLGDACLGEPGYSVRWVVLHLIEETARHAGHADITRELVDGLVGYSRYERD